MVVRNPSVAKGLFIFSNILLILSMYQRSQEPLHFALMAGGLVVISFFLLRAIQQLTGDNPKEQE